MWKKMIIISLCISVFIVFSAPISTVNAGEREIKVDWQVVGTIVGSMPLYSEGSLTGVYSLLNLSAQGKPGPAKLTVLSSFFDPEDPEIPSSPYLCPDDYQDARLIFSKNDAVSLFPDQSFFFVSINTTDYGILCFGATGTYFKVKVDIHGGTDRFEGVSGELIAEGYGYPIPPDGTLAGENGTITGTIEFSDE